MTIYIPVWLYWYGGLPFAFVLGYLLCWTRKREVPPDPYRHTRYTDKEHDEYEATVARLVKERADAAAKEAPTTKHARPVAGTWDEDKS